MTTKVKQGDVVFSTKLQKVVKVASDVLTNKEVCTLKNLPISRAKLLKNKYYKLVDKDNNIYVENICSSSHIVKNKEDIEKMIKKSEEEFQEIKDEYYSNEYKDTCKFYNNKLEKQVKACSQLLTKNKAKFKKAYTSKLRKTTYKLTNNILNPLPNYKIGNLYVHYDKDGWDDTRFMVYKYLGCLDDTFAIKEDYVDVDESTVVHIFALEYDSIGCWRDDIVIRVNTNVENYEPFKPLKEFTQKEVDKLVKKLEKETKKNIKCDKDNYFYDRLSYDNIKEYKNILKEIKNFNM